MISTRFFYEIIQRMDSDAFNSPVDITISRLRQKLKDDPGTPRFIKTIWGSRYIFVGSRDAGDAKTR